MAELPILPLKTDAILADTTHMSAEEFGAYCRILFVMWRHGGRLPDSSIELARIAGVSPARWAKIASCVMRPMTIGGGLVSQKRLTDSWLEVQELRRKRAYAANKRWTGKSIANGHAYALQLESKSNANQNQIYNTTSYCESECVEAKGSGEEEMREIGSPQLVARKWRR